MHAGDSEINPYLQQDVLSASPIRLRWMLIRRAEEVCGLVIQLWNEQLFSQGDQWLLRIREILGELLDGIQDPSNPVSSQVADFYVFLLQLTCEVEESRNVGRLAIMRDLLAIESETWRLLVEKQGREDGAGPAAGNFVHPPALGAFGPSQSGDFSLEV